MSEKIYTNEELKAALENEIIDDAELDAVAGGTHDETYKDMQYLHRYCGVNFDSNSWDRSIDKLGELFHRAGMKLDTSERHNNRYYDSNGYQIDRNTALYRLGCAINDGRVSKYV